MGSKFIAIDGEAVEGKYVLMCASNGQTLYSENELSSFECFEYLLQLKKHNAKAKFVCFGLNYDVNMMLRDLPKEKLKTLWDEGGVWVTFQGASYHLDWIPRKCFGIYSPDLKTRIRIYDVFGFFQSSFVRALDDWKIKDPFGEIKAMKAERARFSRDQMEEIERYCLSECKLLVKLMDKLDGAMLDAGIHLRSYMGAGSVAGALLQKEKVKAHHVSDSSYSMLVRSAIHSAYFGGRIELFMQGSFTDLVNYDIRSAYPFQSLNLPSLKGGRWTRARRDDLDKPNLDALWQVEWTINGDEPVMPFPLRKDGNIYYPTNGRGWYHHAEVRAALAIFPDEIRILRGLRFDPSRTERPFAFVRAYYQKRVQAKLRGEASEKAYKLGLNSLYGKLAQGMSQRGEPPFRSLYWAGKITAGTRARLLDCASLAPRHVISISTDGIVYSGDPGIVESDQLGGFERVEYDDFFIAQPGIYRATVRGGKEIRKSRGFFLREIDFDDLEAGWLKSGAAYIQKAVCECGHVHVGKCDRMTHRNEPCDCEEFSRRRRFLGIGAALMRSDFTLWRTWQESDRILSLTSSRKFYVNGDKGRTVRLRPPSFPGIIDSEPYVPKSKSLEAREQMKELVDFFDQEQKLDELEV